MSNLHWFSSIPSVLRLAALLLMIVAIGCQPPPPAAKPAEPPPAAKPAEQPPQAGKPAASAPEPAAKPAAKPAVQGDRLVIALTQWGNEKPFYWEGDGYSRILWDPIHDPLFHRDPQTYAMQPGLATEWKPSSDYKSWTFKLRQGVMFHENWGEFTADDVKFSVEPNLRPDATGPSAPFFRSLLDRIETPDKYTVVMHFKSPSLEVPAHFAQATGFVNIYSKKYVETVGEDKARQSPIGTGPFRFVEGRQGDSYRFEAVPNHWRLTPGFKELVIRRVPEQAARLNGLRAGEIDIAPLSGDFLAQAKQGGLKIHEVKGGGQYIISLPGQTLPDKPDYCPSCPWVGEPDDPRSLENAKKVRLAMNLAVNKQAIVDGLWEGYGAIEPFVYFFYPHHKGFSREWKVPPYDPERAKQLLAEAGHPNGFEISATGTNYVLDGPDVMEAVALDWEKLGLKVKRATEDVATFNPKLRARKGVTFWPHSSSVYDEPARGWQLLGSSKGTFYTMGETSEHDRMLEAVLAEMDSEKRVKLQVDLGQKTYDDLRYVMIGVKSTTWGVSKKVGTWPTLVATRFEQNFDQATPAGQ